MSQHGEQQHGEQQLNPYKCNCVNNQRNRDVMPRCIIHAPKLWALIFNYNFFHFVQEMICACATGRQHHDTCRLVVRHGRKATTRQQASQTAPCRLVVFSSGAGAKRQHDKKPTLRYSRSDKSTSRQRAGRQSANKPTLRYEPSDKATSRQHAARQRAV